MSSNVSSLPSSVVCCMINFANSLNPDQARQNVGPDLDSNCLTLFLRDFLKKVNIEKWQIVRTRKYNVLISLQYRIALDT